MEQPRDRPIVHRAAWVLPIVSEPIYDGAVAFEEGVVAGVGPAEEILAAFPLGRVHNHPDAILLPPLVNAHTHLALSHQAGRHPEGAGLLPWLTSLIAAVRVMDPADVDRAVTAGAEESWRLGTGLVGEIASFDGVVGALSKHPGLFARVFFEVIGVTEATAEASFERALKNIDSFPTGGNEGGRFSAGLSPHAPYSLWPTVWHRTVNAAAARGLPWTTHLAEPAEEDRFMRDGKGGLVDYFKAIGVSGGGFPVPGMSGAEFLLDQDLIDDRSLLVHGVHLTEDEIAGLTLADAAICLCPRSNAYLGLPPAPIESLYHSGALLCLGTDSKASNHDLGVWGEMRAVHELASSISPAALVRMATANGAMALGFTGRAGTLHPGAPQRMIAVEAPSLGRGDPHRFLVEEPVEDRVRWVAPAPANLVN